MVDRRVRRFRYIGRMPDDITKLVRELLAAFACIA
jgi:hypothetical protein